MKKRSGAPKSAKMRTKAKLDFETRAKSAGVFVQKATRTKSVTKRQRSIRNRRTASGADRHLECGLERLLHCKKEIAAVQWPRNPSHRKKRDGSFPSSLQRRRAQEQRTHAAPGDFQRNRKSTCLRSGINPGK